MVQSPGFHVTRWWSAQPLAHHGFWGPSTSSIDWCEANYAVTRFIAEFTNTLSNFVFVAWALYGVKKCWQERLPIPLALCQVGIAMVGIGSFLFHATLRYEWQLGDELPMIFCCTFISYVAFDTGSVDAPRAPSIRYLSPILSCYAFGVTFIYLKYPNPVFHQVAYAFIQIVATVRFGYTLYTMEPKSVCEKKNKSDASWCQGAGNVLFLFGFLCWNIDNWYCDAISAMKERIGVPLSFVLEGHAWWHLTTGTGVYLIVIGLQLMSLTLKEGAEGFEMRRAGFLGLCPYVARTPIKKD